MSYQENSSVANINQLLSQLKTFLIADGWTVDAETNTGSTPSLSIHKGTAAISLSYANVGGDGRLTVATARAFGVAPTSSVYANDMHGSFSTVWFFSDPAMNYCHVVATKGNGEFLHFSFGWVDNLGFSTRTWYATGQIWDHTNVINQSQQSETRLSFCGQLALNIPDNVLDESFAPDGDIATTTIRTLIDTDRFTSNPDFPYSGTVAPSFAPLDYVFDLANSPTTGGVHLHSMPVIARQGGFDHNLGIIPNARLCVVADLADGQEITNSGDVWKVFPVRRRGLRSSLAGGSAPVVQTNSIGLGFAYKKVV